MKNHIKYSPFFLFVFTLFTLSGFLYYFSINRVQYLISLNFILFPIMIFIINFIFSFVYEKIYIIFSIFICIAYLFHCLLILNLDMVFYIFIFFIISLCAQSTGILIKFIKVKIAK